MAVLRGSGAARFRALERWLDAFKPCFGHRAQLVSFSHYVQGLLSDSRRKSMSAMLERVTDPVGYQAFQHFITSAPWDAECVWTQLRAQIPDRRGVVVIDGTSFPKQGGHSVGVMRQYCGALGKIANCQVAVTAALWTGARSWCVGALLYLPAIWLTPAARAKAQIASRVDFEEKWRLALTLLRRLRAARFAITAVLADAEFGDNARFRAYLHRAGLPYAVGVSSTLTVFRGTPSLRPPRQPRRGPGHARPTLPPGVRPQSLTVVGATLPARSWRRLTWRNGAAPRRAAEFACLRVTPATDWRRYQLAPEVWLLIERRGTTPDVRYHLVHLPASASLRALVQLTHQRWAIERQYQDLKDELGLDHFEGRSLPGWQHHVVLTAIAYNFLQSLRGRRDARLTLPAVRGIVQEVFTLFLFAQRPHYLRAMDRFRGVQLRI